MTFPFLDVSGLFDYVERCQPQIAVVEPAASGHYRLHNRPLFLIFFNLR